MYQVAVLPIQDIVTEAGITSHDVLFQVPFTHAEVAKKVLWKSGRLSPLTTGLNVKDQTAFFLKNMELFIRDSLSHSDVSSNTINFIFSYEYIHKKSGLFRHQNLPMF